MFYVIINVKLISKEIFMTEVLILLPSRKTSLLIKMFTEKNNKKHTQDLYMYQQSFLPVVQSI